MAGILLQIVIVPIFSSIAVFLSAKKIGEKTGWIAFASLFYALALALALSAGLSAEDGVYTEEYSWVPAFRLSFGLRLDGLSLPFVMTIGILSTLIALYSIPYMKHRIGEASHEYGTYFALYLLYAAGMQGAVLSTNLIEFYLFYELMLIPSYFLIAQWGYGNRERIAFMYFIWTHVGALSLLAGIISTHVLTLPAGSFDIYEIQTILQMKQYPSEVIRWISIAMFLGFFVKMAVFGLHIWLPHAHAEAPTPISALLSPAMIGIGGYGMVRIPMSLFPEVFGVLGPLLSIWAVVTMIYGGMMALAQDDLKRLLAYSSISQMGYILFGITSLRLLGISGSMFHYVSHGIGKGILFMVAGAIMLQTEGLRSIKKLGGLASKMPITSTAAIIGFLTIMGIPPLSGFQSEWMLFMGVFQEITHNSHSSVRLLIAYVGILSTVLTASYGLWTIRRVFFGKRPDHLEGVKEASPLVIAPLLILIALSIVFGIFPSLITDFLLEAMKSIVPS
ncbi:NADH-quinone oxidoreductase subunit M [Candidatus Bathyarchaeota archaeon]|nr:NADH-quinone oxidoreductase subunit M [Candidatus Bathyarchaeota archaeon]